jgi:nucleoside-diphosphate-sugar epimerase
MAMTSCFFPFSASILLLGAVIGSHGAAAQTVCVTGAGGYVATELVKQLLENGFHVKGTVRSLSKTEKFQHLKLMDAALPGTLELLEADLLKPGSFDSCASGSKYVFHTASPFHFQAEDSLEDMIKPARDGTENVIKSAIKAKSERVIVTSSFAASNSFLPDDKPDSGALYSEEDWNDFIDESVWKENKQQAYIASKSIAERKAWELGKKHGISVVVIQPVLVMGPVHAPRVDGVSVGTMKNVVEGAALPFSFPWCDNRDVAKAHIAAAVNPTASGRYIVSHPDLIPAQAVFNTLSKAFPQYAWTKPETDTGYVPIINNTKVLSLIGGLYPLEDTMLDMARSLISAKLATPKVVKSEL